MGFFRRPAGSAWTPASGRRSTSAGAARRTFRGTSGLPGVRDAAAASGRGVSGLRRAARAFDAAFAPYRYEFPLVELIHGLKYGGEIASARILGTVLGRRIAERGRPCVDAIVPVPLFPAREARRGYNQAREIAVFAAAELRLPVLPRLARRVRDTAEQAKLPAAERLRESQGRIRVAGRAAAARSRSWMTC